MFVIIYLEEDKKKKWYWIYKFKGCIGKINISFKMPRNKPNVRISHSLKFLVKPNIEIFTFPSIQIARHYIPRNLNARVIWIPPYQMPKVILLIFIIFIAFWGSIFVISNAVFVFVLFCFFFFCIFLAPNTRESPK